MGLRRTTRPALAAPRPSAFDTRPAARFVLCLVLAYVLVIQGVLGALALGANASLAEAGSSVLCLGHAGSDDADGSPPVHDGSCCVLGCVAGGAPMLLAPEKIAFSPPAGEARHVRFLSARPAAPPWAPTIAFLARGPPKTA